jgi:hypothetical protein
MPRHLNMGAGRKSLFHSAKTTSSYLKIQSAPRSRRYQFRPIPYSEIARAALSRALDIASHYAPGGRVQGGEYVALNPTRGDRSPGSFRLNLRTGRWADFATNDKGGDLISYVAYCRGEPNWRTAISLGRWLSVETSIEDCQDMEAAL